MRFFLLVNVTNRLVLLLALAFYCQADLFAQKNRIELRQGGFLMDRSNGPTTIFDLTGVTIERRISKRYSIYAQASTHDVYWRLTQGLDFMNFTSTMARISYAVEGKLRERINYTFFDLGGTYRLYQHKNHRLSVTQAISGAYGIDGYITKILAIDLPNEPFHIIAILTEYKKELYIGGVTGLKYDYMVWKNRINVGAYAAARYYNRGFPFQWNYGVQLGFNF